MNVEMLPSSPAISVGKLSLPIKQLQPGFSFAVQFDQAGESQLRTYVSRAAKKLGCKMRVKKHETCYEVARIA